jgi:hypothetical protein
MKIEPQNADVYYCAEDCMFIALQALFRKKIKKTENIKRFILFSIKQCNYDLEFDYALMKKILQMEFELHFAREEFSIYDIDDLNDFL